MPRTVGKETFRPRVSLHLAASFEAAWENVILPWFEKEAPRAFEQQLPVAVVTPFRSHAYFLRSRLLARDISLLGVQFLLPAQLREFLQTNESLHVPLREHLRLLLSCAAEECAADFEREDKIDAFQIAKAIAREPDRLLRAIDNVTAAGATFGEFASPGLAEIAKRFDTILKACGCLLVPEADRLSLRAARAGRKRFSKVLIGGFDAAHWPLWPLLCGAVLATQEATVLLRDPRDEAAEPDRVWISTWEENFGAAHPVPPSALELEPRFARLLTVPESSGEIAARKRESLENVHFILGHDCTNEAQAIAGLAVAFLAEPLCQHLAILLPGPGALARLIGSELESMQIPHNDGIAHQTRGVFDTEEWRAWLQLQARPQLEPLLRFLQNSSGTMVLFAPLPLRKIQNTLRRACSDILINSVDVLREYCRSNCEESDCQKIAAGLSAIRFLPERATFKEFLGTANEIFRGLEWTERSVELSRLARNWSDRFTSPVLREHFLRWLTELFAESSTSRDSCGDHPYARVQLLRYDEAEFGSYSHLILAGLNEGVWPPGDEESPFLPDHTIAAINRRNIAESERFGIGQQTAREDTTLCLDTLQRRKLVQRQLLNIIESTTQAIGVAAERYTHSPREQAVNPSEFFARLYFSARGEALSQAGIAAIAKDTRHWLAAIDLFEPAAADDIDIRQTKIAYLTRRSPDTEFDEYEFAFRKGSPPAAQISLSATEIGTLLTRPALVWMKVFLGVSAEEAGASSWNLATGQWVHRWLASIGARRENRFVPRPAADEILRRVTGAADHFREKIGAILKASGRTREPDWWESGWRNARHLAEQFARQVAATEEWPQLATEWQLDSPNVVQLNQNAQLLVRGRLDLILTRHADPEQIWIIDYKTGEAEPLKSSAEKFRRQLVDGNGVQICVYALALRDHSNDIVASLLTRDLDMAPQVTLSDVVTANDLWNEMARIERTGIFGMLGDIRSDFTFTGTYPLATLSVDTDLLARKWVRTHPAFAKHEAK